MWKTGDEKFSTLVFFCVPVPRLDPVARGGGKNTGDEKLATLEGFSWAGPTW
jgi:hypothetical protein